MAELVFLVNLGLDTTSQDFPSHASLPWSFGLIPGLIVMLPAGLEPRPLKS